MEASVRGGAVGTLTGWLAKVAAYCYLSSLCLSIHHWSSYLLCFFRWSPNVSQVASLILSPWAQDCQSEPPFLPSGLFFQPLPLPIEGRHKMSPSWPSTHAHSSCSLQRSQSREEKVHQAAIQEREQLSYRRTRVRRTEET